MADIVIGLQAVCLQSLPPAQLFAQFGDGFLAGADLCRLSIFLEVFGQALPPQRSAGSIDVLKEGVGAEQVEIDSVGMMGVDESGAVIPRRSTDEKFLECLLLVVVDPAELFLESAFFLDAPVALDQAMEQGQQEERNGNAGRPVEPPGVDDEQNVGDKYGQANQRQPVVARLQRFGFCVKGGGACFVGLLHVHIVAQQR